MKLRVFHIPQVPMKAFYVEVNSVEEGVKLMNTLALYDDFQYKNNVKGDYCNLNGLEMYDESLTDQNLIDMDAKDRWVDWYYDVDEDYYDSPEAYLEAIKTGELILKN